MKEMTVGEFVDFVVEWNKMNIQTEEDTKNKPKRRKATQADWDAFWG